MSEQNLLLGAAKRTRRGKSTLTLAVEEIGKLRQKQEDDQKENERRLSGMHVTIMGMPVKQDVTDLRDLIVGPDGQLKLATKDDVDQILSVFKNLKAAASLVSGTGHWAWRLLVGLAMFIALISFITGGAKLAIAYLVNHAIGA